MKKGDGRGLSHEVLEAYRYRAVELYKKGKSVINQLRGWPKTDLLPKRVLRKY